MDKRRSRALMQAGLAALMVAMPVRQMLSQNPRGLSESAVDGGTGLLYGVAIGLLLLALWQGHLARSRA